MKRLLVLSVGLALILLGCSSSRSSDKLKKSEEVTTSTTIINCKLESEFVTSSITGVIVGIRVSPDTFSTFFVVADEKGSLNRFVFIEPPQDILQVGRKVNVVFHSSKNTYRVCGGARELVKSLPYDYELYTGVEPNRNLDGTISFVQLGWRVVYLSGITLIP